MCKYKRFFVAVFLIAGSTAVFSQPGAHDHAREKPVRKSSADKDGQERSAALRQALRSNRAQLAMAESAAGRDRQLSAQERSELRQQLRQQQRDEMRP